VAADGHGVRKINIGNKNIHFQKEIGEAQARWKKKKKSTRNKPFPKYWQGHVRIAGLKQRDGHGVVVALPIRLVPPLASPPPEGKQEIIDSKILKRLDHKKDTRLFADGAQGWPAAIKSQGLRNVRHVAVSHKKLQFTKKLKLKKKGRFSNTGGTQAVDRWWELLENFMPTQLHCKTKKGGPINPELFRYIFAFAWRCSVPANADMRAEIGKICSRECVRMLLLAFFAGDQAGDQPGCDTGDS